MFTPISIFSITLPRCFLGREFVYQVFLPIASELIVAEENENGILRILVYLKTNENDKMSTSELRKYFENHCIEELPDDFIFIKECKSAASRRKYVTKEDRHPRIYNVPIHDTNFNYRSIVWATNTPVFCFSDPFVLENCSNYKFLQLLHEEIRRKKLFSSVPKFIFNREIDWVESLAIALRNNNNVYLFGPTGVGKTVAVETLFEEGDPRWHEYTEILGGGGHEYEFSGVSSSTRRLYTPNAPSDYFESHRAKLLRLAEHRVVPIHKRKQSLAFALALNMVIVSDFPPPTDPAFLRRYTVIEAETFIHPRITEE